MDDLLIASVVEKLEMAPADAKAQMRKMTGTDDVIEQARFLLAQKRKPKSENFAYKLKKCWISIKYQIRHYVKLW